MLSAQFNELTQREKLLKKLYLNHPELQLDIYRTRTDVDFLTKELPEYRQIQMESPHYFLSGSPFSEQLIPTSQDVSLSLHERYLPCCIHSHDFFEITCLLYGDCHNYIAGKEFCQKSGDISILAPGTPHAVKIFSDETVMINILIRFSTFQRVFFGTLSHTDILSAFFSKALYSSNATSYLVFETGNDKELLDLILRLYQESKEMKPYAAQMLNSLVTTMFIILLRRHQQHLTVPNPAGNKNNQDIMFILNYIISNYKDLSLSQLADLFDYSERQMSRILKDYTGKNFLNIIQNIKLQHACELLQNPNIPIAKIISTVGYANATHFYTVFKEQYHMTPAKWRELYISVHL